MIGKNNKKCYDIEVKGHSSSARMAVSKTAEVGSIPTAPAIMDKARFRRFFRYFDPCYFHYL